MYVSTVQMPQNNTQVLYVYAEQLVLYTLVFRRESNKTDFYFKHTEYTFFHTIIFMMLCIYAVRAIKMTCLSFFQQINMKTMPAVMFRLLTGQETPVYI